MALPPTGPPPSLRWEWIIPGAILGLLALYALYRLLAMQAASLVTPPKPETPSAVQSQPDDTPPRDYTHYGRKEETPPPIPQAQYVRKDAGASPDAARDATLVSVVQAQNALMERLVAQLATMQTTQQGPQTDTKPAPAPSPGVAAQPLRKTPLKFLVDNQAGATEDAKQKAEQDKDSLLEPAHWIRPLDKSRVLYRQQVLPGRLKIGLNSDTPGMALIEVTIPIYSRQGGKILLDKGTVIIAKYEGEVKFGQTRVPVKVEEAQPPDGDIIELKALGGDEEGRAGVTGRVNNHYAKLALATGINAVLQLGVKGLAGTPGQGQYFQNPAQQAAQDVGQSVAQDINSVVRQQLKVPPTVETDAGAIVSVLLEKNLSFYRPPKIVK